MSAVSPLHPPMQATASYLRWAFPILLCLLYGALVLALPPQLNERAEADSHSRTESGTEPPKSGSRTSSSGTRTGTSSSGGSTASPERPELEIVDGAKFQTTVLGIIALLLSLAFVAWLTWACVRRRSRSKKKARDARRDQEITRTQNFNSLTLAENSSFPCPYSAAIPTLHDSRTVPSFVRPSLPLLLSHF